MRVFTMIMVLAAGGVSACASFPEVDAATSADIQKAAYPNLLPLDTLLGGVPPMPEEDPAEAELEKAEALKAKADGLRNFDPSAP